MKKNLTRPAILLSAAAAVSAGAILWSGSQQPLEASSHREAPLIADDPLADNTDVYAFRSPDDDTKVTLIADFIPFQLPQGGPNYYHFGENVRYELHIKNNPATTGDDITYRFTFTRTNQDPTTHFNIRLGKENLKTTYTCEQSIAGGAFTTLVTNGVVPAYNVGPRAISSPVGLNAPNYRSLMTSAIQTLGNGMKIFCGPVDDPFFVDIGGIEDVGNIRPNAARDGLFHKNANAIVMQVPIAMLQRTGQPVSAATSILDPNYVIGVWASASRPALRTLVAPDGAGNTTGAQTFSGNYVQVSRLGMPLHNEAVNPVGAKDEWNARTPATENRAFDEFLNNPELGLYMADDMPVAPAAPKPAGQTYYGEAVPGFAPLRIQSKSLAGFPGLPAAGFDFRNGANGLSGLTAAQRAGTVFADPTYGPILLQAGKPRSVDLLPIFLTGVPNLPPYQLATGKPVGNPLAAGKPFVNNFLPTLGDMLRLNMAVPVTPRNSADFSSEGLLAAAVLGITDPRFNTSTALQNIPNMDGFPNGRRLEDDVVRIELQAVGGVVLASLGLFYDDYTTASASGVTPRLQSVLGFRTGIERNDTTITAAFPFVQTPWSGINAQPTMLSQRSASGLGVAPNIVVAQAYPNPFVDRTTFHFELGAPATLSLVVSDMMGRQVAIVSAARNYGRGEHELVWLPNRSVAAGQYVATLYSGSTVVQSVRIERQ